jgi:hypothetical protein
MARASFHRKSSDVIERARQSVSYVSSARSSMCAPWWSRATWRAAAALGLGAVLLSRAAQADPYSFHVEAAAAAAWTDNAANRSEVAEENQTIPQSGFFTQLRPALLFTYETPRSVHVSTAGMDLNLYQTEEPANTYNGTLLHNSLFALSPVTELGLGASLGFGRVDPLILEQAGQIQGDTTFVSGGINQNTRWQATRDWRLDQGFGVNLVSTEQGGGDTLASSVAMSVGADRAWARTALGLVGSVNYVTIDQSGNDSTQLISNVSANVRRDLDPVWSLSAAAGLGFIVVTEQPEPPNEASFAPTPTGSFTVNYLQPLGTVTAAVSATVSHAITPNLLLGNVTNTSSGTLTAGLPLPGLWRDQEPIVAFGSSVGIAHSRPSLGASEPSWNTYSANGAVSWSVDDGLALALRYQFVRIDVQGAMMDTSVQPPEDFFRHTILLEASGRFPARQAVQLPDRAIRRVDRSNEAPIGGDENEQARGDAGE